MYCDFGFTNFKKILSNIIGTVWLGVCSPIIETSIFEKKSIRRTHTIDFS